METLADFVSRLSRAVGCHYHFNNPSGLYSLKKNDSNQRLQMGVFGWVRELKGERIFKVSSYKDLGDKAGVSHLADDVKPTSEFGKPGIIFNVKPDSKGRDYKKTVKALKAILALKLR
jgi:hypothetical protein